MIIKMRLFVGGALLHPAGGRSMWTLNTPQLTFHNEFSYTYMAKIMCAREKKKIQILDKLNGSDDCFGPISNSVRSIGTVDESQ